MFMSSYVSVFFGKRQYGPISSARISILDNLLYKFCTLIAIVSVTYSTGLLEFTLTTSFIGQDINSTCI